MAVPGGADLELLLQQFLGQDNNVRRVAEKHLAKALKTPQSIPAFLDRIGASSHPEVRQLAATLLRKKIGALWSGLRSEDHVAVEQALLQSLQAESQRLVRLAVAHLISVVAKFTLPSKRWPELLPFLLQLLQAQEVVHREIAMTLIHALCERIPAFMRQHLGHLVDVFLKGLGDSEMLVRFATLRAVAPVVSLVEEDDELQQIARLLGPTVTVLQEAIERQGHVGQEDESSLELVLSVFEVFDDLAELPLSTVRQHLHGLVQAMLQIAGNSQAHIAVRERAVSIIGSIAADNPKLLARLGLVEPVIQLLIAVLVEHYTADIFRGDSSPNGVSAEDDDDDDFDASGIQFASQLLDQLAGTLPNNVVLPLVLQFAQQQFANPPSPGASPATRRGAVLALSVVCAECRDPLREMVPQLLDLVLIAVSDAEVPVREAACVCLSRFVENLQPEILSHHGRILPVVFQALDDSNEKVQQKACYMLDKIGEGMERDFVQYLEPVCTRLLALLGRCSTATQAYVVQSLGAIAAGVEDLFKPYAPALLSLVQQVMNSEQPEHYILRARCTEIAGIIAGILGEEGFAPYEQELYQRAMVGLRLDCSELREYTFGFLANLAQIHGKNWAPRLAETVPVVLHAIQQDDGQLRSAPGLFGRDAAVDLRDEDDEAEANDSDADEEDESGRPPILRVRTSDLDMKSAALHTLGAFALMTEEHFWPYFESSFEASLKLVQYFHSDVRSNAILSMKNQLAAAYHRNPGLPWRPGNPEVDTLHPDTRKPVDFLVTLCLERMENDESKDVVASCCEALVDVLKALGPASLHQHMNKLMDLLMTLLRQKAYCQTREDDEDQGLDDHPDHDQTLIDNVADLVDTLAKAYAAGFTLHMTAVMPELLRYLGPKRPTSDHVMAVGSFAEIAIGMGPAIEPFAPKLMEIFVHGLTSKDAGVRSNAAYGVGALSQQVPALMTPHFPTLLQRLRPLLDDQQPNNVVDNTCACIARMIQTNKDACHLEQVLPVWLARLPLRQDALEHVTVYQCIGFLLREAGDLLGPHQQHIVRLLAHGATHHSTDSACKELCTGLLATLLPQAPQLLAEALNGLPAEAQQALRAKLGV